MVSLQRFFWLMLIGMSVQCLNYGCSSLKQQNIPASMKPPVEGSFHNVANDSIHQQRLWDVLNYGRETEKSSKDDVVSLQVEDKKVRVYLFRNSSLIDSVSIAGRYRKNYFVGKRRSSVIPIPLLYGNIQHRQIQLSSTADGQLNIDFLDYAWGWVFFFFADRGGVSTASYAPIQ